MGIHEDPKVPKSSSDPSAGTTTTDTNVAATPSSVDPPIDVESLTLGGLLALLMKLKLGSIAALVTGVVTVAGVIFQFGVTHGEAGALQARTCSRLAGVYREKSQLTQPFFGSEPICASPRNETLILACSDSGVLSINEFSYNEIYATARSAATRKEPCGASKSDKPICLYTAEWYFAGQKASASTITGLQGEVLRRVHLEECGQEASLDSKLLSKISLLKEQIRNDFPRADCILNPIQKTGEVSEIELTCTYGKVSAVDSHKAIYDRVRSM